MSAKPKKKRTKKYHGADARVSAPAVTRVSAEERSPFREWWLVYRQIIKIGATVLGVLAAIILIIIGIFGLF